MEDSRRSAWKAEIHHCPSCGACNWGKVGTGHDRMCETDRIVPSRYGAAWTVWSEPQHLELLALAKEYASMAMLRLHGHYLSAIGEMMSKTFRAMHGHHWVAACEHCNFQRKK